MDEQKRMALRSYQYASEFTPADEGGSVITFPDIPGAITQGESIEQCIDEASDALGEALVARMTCGKNFLCLMRRKPDYI